MFNKLKAAAYVAKEQALAPGHYDVTECRGCGDSIQSNFDGLCADCQSEDRAHRRAIRGDHSIEDHARIIREHKEGLI